MIKILLVSPMDPPFGSSRNLRYLMGGESTFTKTLLANPPEGIEYTHYSKALEDRTVKYLLLHRLLSYLVKLRILPISAGSQCIKIIGNFDLVHCHSYSIKLSGKIVPLVLSDSSSNFLFLKDYLRWPLWRIKIGFALRKLLFGLFGVSDPDVNLNKSKKLITFSNFAKKIHSDLGANQKMIQVIYPGLPGRKNKRPKDTIDKKRINILFVGVWFERKGGHLLLEAFKILSSKYPNTNLIILGPIPKKFDVPKQKVFQRNYVSYRELLKKFYPQADILVLVPPLAEGFGLVVLEAASFAIPAIVSKVYALPELVEDGKTGFVINPGSLDQLVEKLEILIKDNKLRQNMGQAAKNRFEEKFSLQLMQKKLLRVYREAISSN